MSYFSVDIEADGPIPFKYSMVCFGAVIVEPGLSRTFYGRTKPISTEWNPEALAVSGFSREQHEQFDDPKVVMQNFAIWIEKNNSDERPIFITDNLAFDWQWINFYFHYFLGRNPFGFSGRRIGDLYSGLEKDLRAGWKRKLRKTSHDHHPVNDAKGNAEALLEMHKMGLRIY